jgi:nucleotide-binding universal stress UspA family protein
MYFKGLLPRIRSVVMHRHILLPTDGSELSEQAVNYGVTLAEVVSAKVTGLPVSTPFHILAVEPHMVTDTLKSYTSRMSTVAAAGSGERCCKGGWR